METYLHNPSRDELKQNAYVVLEIIRKKSEGYKVGREEDTIYYIVDDEKILLGTLPNLAETAEYLFGDNVPNSIEYITIDGITFMMDGGKAIACGYLETPEMADTIFDINEFLNDNRTSLAAGVVEFFTNTDIHEKASKVTAGLEMLHRWGGTSMDYDNTVALIQNYANFVEGTGGAGEVIEAYGNITTTAILQALVRDILLNLELSNETVVECAKKKDSSIVIEWAEDNVKAESTILSKNELPPDKAYKYMRDDIKNHFHKATEDVMEDIFEEYETATYADPLVFDLENDGFNINALTNGTYFDMNADGFAEKVNWTTQDAFLALDLNEDGAINDATELFGDQTVLATGEKANNGFEALAQYDTNGDGIINSDDEIFSKLLIWQDTDGDGFSGSGELKTLAEIGIKEICLNYSVGDGVRSGIFNVCSR